jgi:hypothetical protein
VFLQCRYGASRGTVVLSRGRRACEVWWGRPGFEKGSCGLAGPKRQPCQHAQVAMLWLPVPTARRLLSRKGGKIIVGDDDTQA